MKIHNAKDKAKILSTHQGKMIIKEATSTLTISYQKKKHERVKYLYWGKISLELKN